MTLEQHIKFLKECKRQDVIPKGMFIKSKTNIPKNKHVVQETMNKIRNNTLEFRYKQSNELQREIKTQEEILREYIKRIDGEGNLEKNTGWINKHDGKMKNKMEQKHQEKIKKLMENQKKNQKKEKDQDTSNIINMSNRTLSIEQLGTLAKGLRFIPTPKTINIIDTITNTETALTRAPKILKQTAISEVVTFIQKWKKPRKDNMTKNERKCIQELRQMNDITITMADKGGMIVVLNKDEYIQKVEEKLDDKNLYEKTKDPTKKIKKQLADLVENHK